MYVSAEVITMVSTGIALMGLLGGLFAWALRRIDRRFDAVDRRFEAVDQQFLLIRTEIANIRSDIRNLSERDSDLSVRVARLEGPQSRFLLGPR